MLAGDAAGNLENLVPPGGVRMLDLDAILLEFEQDLQLTKSSRVPPLPARQTHRPAPPSIPAWRKALAPLFAAPAQTLEMRYAPRNRWPAGAELLYMLQQPNSANSGDLALVLYVREPRKDGGWKKPQMLHMSRHQIVELPLSEDREIIAQLAGTSPAYYSDLHEIPNQLCLAQPLAQMLAPRILATGRCFLFNSANQIGNAPLHWDDGPAWKHHKKGTHENDSRPYFLATHAHQPSRIHVLHFSVACTGPNIA